MSFLLTSESGAQTGWAHFAWPIVRKLAEDFGWHPCGTLPPEDWDPDLEAIGEWNGSYSSNDGQLVTAQDPAALGNALTAALASRDFEFKIQQLNRAATEAMQSPAMSVTLGDGVASWRKDIEEFSAFCKSGGFRLF